MLKPHTKQIKEKIVSLQSGLNMTVKQRPAKKKQTNSFSLVRYAIKGIEEKKGSDIVCINFKKNSNSPCDYFLICEGNSRTQVQAIAESVETFVEKKACKRPWHIEGLQNAEWVLIDYVDVVVHIFQPHIRQYYGLEDMWADAEIKKIKLNNAFKPTQKVHRTVKRKAMDNTKKTRRKQKI